MRSICEILKESKTIAVIGYSIRPGRMSGTIASFLKESGYTVYGINPFHKESNNITVYNSLEEIEDEIDIVNVFRRSSAIPEIIPSVINKKPKTLWLQTGISNDEAVAPLKEMGIEVIQNRCIVVEYRFCF
jgi:uncharacterized protein